MIVVAAAMGCGEPSAFERAELWITARGWYGLTGLVTGCALENTGVTYAVDGMSLPPGLCGGTLTGLQEDRPHTVTARKGGETAQAVVADMFPGLAAVVQEPANGRVRPGGDIVIGIPAALEHDNPDRAWFTYLDDDDPAYTGEQVAPAQALPVRITAPVHRGHFRLEVEMTPADEAGHLPGRVISCSGISSCKANAALDMGPFQIEVTGD
jgi:hypothetical protein